MKPFKLIAKPENIEDKVLASIEVVSNQGWEYVTIWSDGRLTFNPTLDYDFEEIDKFVLISNNFYLFFNNIKTQ